jgi:hypothetical protein
MLDTLHPKHDQAENRTICDDDAREKEEEPDECSRVPPHLWIVEEESELNADRLDHVRWVGVGENSP